MKLRPHQSPATLNHSVSIDGLQLCVGLCIHVCSLLWTHENYLNHNTYRLHTMVRVVIFFTERAVYHFVEYNIHLNPHSRFFHSMRTLLFPYYSTMAILKED